MLRLAILATLALAAPAGAQAAAPAPAPDRHSFGLDWKGEAERGGCCQAAATGIYARHGLQVAIRQGGPQANQAQLMLAGRLDLALASNSFLAPNFAREALPFIAAAAMFQRDPAVLLAHPGQDHDTFESLRGQPVMIGADSRASWWTFLRARFGCTDAQIRSCTFSPAPFLSDPHAVQQGCLGSEPFLVRQAAGFDPVVLLLTDAGSSGYARLVATSTRLAETKPDLVQRFIDASAKG